MALAQLADVEAILGRTVEEGGRAQALRLLDMASGVARGEMGGQFIEKVTGDTITVRMDSDGVLRLPQRPVTAITSVSMGSTLLAASTYWWDPGDGSIRSVWDRPWQMLSINSIGAPIHFTVVYDHGFEVVPDDIVTVVAQMAADVMIRSWRGAKDGTLPVAGLGLSLNRAQKAVLNSYKRRFTSVDVAVARHA